MNGLTVYQRKIGELTYFPGKKLGSGGFATVIEGELGNKKVAVKQIDLMELKAVKTELSVLELHKSLCHKNMVKYLHYEQDDDFLYIAVELCRGSLKDAINKVLGGYIPSPGPNEEILRQVTLGLQFLHSKGIVHRDLHPGNILISDKAIVKLSDFGLISRGEHQVDAGIASFLMSGNSIGTHGWAAPEFYQQQRHHGDDATNKAKLLMDGYAADIFSLGCVFGYTMSGGGHPFGETMSDRVHNIKTKRIDWHRMKKVVNLEMSNMIFRMISNDPRQRPSLEMVLVKLVEQLIVNQVILPVDAYSSKIFHDIFAQEEEEFAQLVDKLISYTNRTFNVINRDGQSFLLLMYKTFKAHGRLGYTKKLVSSSQRPAKQLNCTDKKNRNALTYLLGNLFDEEDDIVELALLLISNGIDVNARTSRGHTAIGLAIVKFGASKKKGLLPILVELLKRNAEQRACYYLLGDWNAIDLACRYYAQDDLINVLRLLIDNGGRVDRQDGVFDPGTNALVALTQSYRHDNIVDVMSLLIEAGADVNCTDQLNLNALMRIFMHLKCAQGLVAAVTLLVSKGINVNHKCERLSWTALHLLTERFGNHRSERLTDVVQILLENGANVNVCNQRGSTPLLNVCCSYQREDLIDVIRLLIKYGANVAQCTSDGRNARTLLIQHYKRDNIHEILSLI